MLVQQRSLKRLLSPALVAKRCYSAPSDGSIPIAKQKYVPTSGTYPKGFLAGSAHAGVKPSNTKFDDLALIVSELPEKTAAAAVFTQNAFKAAPVQVSKKILLETRGRRVRAVVVNSGCANAVTGKGGLEDALAMARQTDERLGAVISQAPRRSFRQDDAEESPSEVLRENLEHPDPEPGANRPIQAETSSENLPTSNTLVMSTGVIGQRLPIDRILSKIPALYESLGNTHDHWLRTARAICTTDTFPKLVSRTFTLPSHPNTTYTMAGMTKGAGMIHPNMATLLAMVCTDAWLSPQALQTALHKATKFSFNSISIDGDTSTNDTCALLSNGAAAPEGIEPLMVRPTKDATNEKLQFITTDPNRMEDWRAFRKVLTEFMTDLAKLVVRDGEGATKFVTIRVTGALNNAIAYNIARSIAKSPLVKTALYGKDANWGRILCAIGYAPGHRTVVPARTSVSFIPADGSEELKLLVRGEPETVDEERAKKILELEDLEILVRLNDGPPSQGAEGGTDYGRAVFWTCDFSHEYVTINGDYRT